MILNWKLTTEERDGIRTIVDRVFRELPNYPDDARTLTMDLTACHNHGCPIALDELATAPAFDFAHDIYGIRRHINRDTGKLENCFTPRCARSNHGEVSR